MALKVSTRAQGQAKGEGTGGQPVATAAGTGGRVAQPRPQQPTTSETLNASRGMSSDNIRVNAGGFTGFFGAEKDFRVYQPGYVADTTAGGNRNRIASQIQEIKGREQASAEAAQAEAASSEAATSQAATINQGPQNQVRQQQQSLASDLQQAAAGNGPSAAQAQLQEGRDAGISQAMALANSARGGNRSVALKQAMMQGGQITQQAANEAARLKATEQQAARGQLAGVLDSTRGSDIGLATSQAGMQQQTALANASNQQQTSLANAANQQQTSLANAQAQTAVSQGNAQLTLQQQQQQDAAVAQLMAQRIGLDEETARREIQQQQFNAGLMAQQQAAAQGVSVQNAAQGVQLAGTIAGAIGAGVASDKRAKKNVEDGDEPVSKLLKALHPKAFDYKEPEKHGEGRHLGVMAQDVEKAAPDMVFDDADGVKKLDLKKALSASLAALGHMDKRLSKIEARRG